MLALNPETLMKYQVLYDGGMTILLLLARADGPLTARQMARLCRIGEHKAGRQLQQLQDLQMVQREQDGYRLCPGALDDLLPAGEANPSGEAAASGESAAAEAEGPEGVKTDGDNGGVPAAEAAGEQPPRGPDEAANSWLNVQFNQQPAVVVNTYPKIKTRNRLITTTTATTGSNGRDSPPPDDREWERNREALRARGIFEPKRSELARLPGMTPERIHGWAQHLQGSNGGEVSPGLLIHMLAQGEPPPESAGTGHPSGCACKACLLGSYLCPVCEELPCICAAAGR